MSNYNLTHEQLNFISEVSIKLGSSPKWNANWKFSIKKYLDGYQFNWYSEKGSLMWRSVNWQKDLLEHYAGSETILCYHVNEI
jgi:hypothetical protein